MQKKNQHTGNNMQESSKVHSLYKRYAYLADIYSWKLFNLDKLSYDRDDVKQDLRIKLFQAITAYGHRWAQYKRTGKYKPVPINIFLRKCMNNMVIDLAKRTQRQIETSAVTDSYEVDMGYEDVDVIDNRVDLKSKQLVINGIDLLEGLDTSHKKGCFMLYTQGFSIRKLCSIFKRHFDAEEVIENHLNKLRNDWFAGIDNNGNSIYAGELFKNIAQTRFITYNKVDED